MTGLTYGEPRVTYSRTQYICFGINAGLLLAWFVVRPPVSVFVVISISYLLGAVAFWGDIPSIDSRLLWQCARDLEGLSWENFVLQALQRPYLEFQTPFIPFMIARLPVRVTQWIFLACGGVTCLVIGVLYGDNAALLMACPALMITLTPPSTDLPMWCLFLLSFWAAHYNIYAAAIIFAGCLMIKPLPLIGMPVLAYLAPWTLYGVIVWRLGWERLPGPLRQRQFEFLSQQSLWRRLPVFQRIAEETHRRTGRRIASRLQWAYHTWRYRLRYVSWPQLHGVPFYFAPILVAGPSWQWPGVAAGILIFGVFGNIKYYLLALFLLLEGL